MIASALRMHCLNQCFYIFWRCELGNAIPKVKYMAMPISLLVFLQLQQHLFQPDNVYHGR